MKHSFYRTISFSYLLNKAIIFSLLLILANANVIAQTPTIQWDKTIGGSLKDVPQVVKQTADGGFILGGYSLSDVSGDKSENSKGLADYWVVKLDASGNKLWDKTIGGDGDDYLNALQQTADNGYILGGYSSSNISGNKSENSKGGDDYWIVKLDENGNILWDKTIGGSNGDDYLFSLQQTSDNGYILGGSSSSNISGDKSENSKGVSDYWVVKLDEDGNKIWDKTIGGSSFDILYSLQQTADNGFILGGYSESNISGDKSENSKGGNDYWIVKLDVDGNIIWDKTIGGNNSDALYSVKQTIDNGYILGGYSQSDISGDKSENSKGDYDYWVVKLDPLGTKVWDRTIGGNSVDNLTSIQQTIDNGYILGGSSFSGISGDKTENSKGGFDYWVIKLSATGSKIWDKTIGGNNFDALSFLQQTADNGYILGGFSGSNISGDKTENSKGDYDYWVVKLGAEPSFSCHANVLVNTEAGQCYAVVQNIDPIIISADDDITVNYKLEKDGSVIEDGTGSVSGKQFTTGITTVTYLLSDDNSQSCSFTVQVKDEELPVPACPSEVRYCYTAAGNYVIPPIAATDNCGEPTIGFVITGATTRQGNGNDASGAFGPGVSVINWTISDGNGNSNSCTTTVVIDKVDVSVPDVFPANINAGIGTPNTIYIGYGGGSITLSAVVTSSVTPNTFIYKWTTGSPGGPSIGTGSTITISPTTATVYYLSVKDASNCKPLYVVSKLINVVDIRCSANKIYICKYKNGSYTTTCIQATTNTVNNMSAGSYLGTCSPQPARSSETVIKESRTVKELTVQAFPNPSGAFFNLFIESPDPNEKVQLKVTNLMGQVIELRKDLSVGASIKIGGNYSRGVYVVEIMQGGYKKMLRIVKI